ncbi:hypothetical protein ABZ916_20085 [Streptomyces sp. NPDC046853]|uniref:hypothetical protein n=1 Tax=Streptomyces sp. NPDC046853 TaxID=3154920 RepID=UPI0033E31CDB
MTQPTPAVSRICGNCDGFATVVITTGARYRDGSRVTLRVHCRTCTGSGSARLSRKQEVNA